MFCTFFISLLSDFNILLSLSHFKRLSSMLFIHPAFIAPPDRSILTFSYAICKIILIFAPKLTFCLLGKKSDLISKILFIKRNIPPSKKSKSAYENPKKALLEIFSTKDIAKSIKSPIMLILSNSPISLAMQNR